MLASEPGTGKTYVLGGAMRELFDAGGGANWRLENAADPASRTRPRLAQEFTSAMTGIPYRAMA